MNKFGTTKRSIFTTRALPRGSEILHLRPSVKLSLESDRRLAKASSPVRGHIYVGAIERGNRRATE
jgi:hypothetical protein